MTSQFFNIEVLPAGKHESLDESKRSTMQSNYVSSLLTATKPLSSFLSNFYTTGLLPLKFPCYLFICVSKHKFPAGLCLVINTFCERTSELDNGKMKEIRSLATKKKAFKLSNKPLSIYLWNFVTISVAVFFSRHVGRSLWKSTWVTVTPFINSNTQANIVDERMKDGNCLYERNSNQALMMERTMR